MFKRGMSYILLLLIILTMAGCNKATATTHTTTAPTASISNTIEEEAQSVHEIRNLTDMKFYDLITYMSTGDYEKARMLLTENVTVENMTLKCCNSTEFVLQKDNLRFRQRTYNVENENTFSSTYEYSRQANERMDLLVVTFKLVDGGWKIDSLDYDA